MCNVWCNAPDQTFHTIAPELVGPPNDPPRAPVPLELVICVWSRFARYWG